MCWTVFLIPNCFSAITCASSGLILNPSTEGAVDGTRPDDPVQTSRISPWQPASIMQASTQIVVVIIDFGIDCFL